MWTHWRSAALICRPRPASSTATSISMRLQPRWPTAPVPSLSVRAISSSSDSVEAAQSADQEDQSRARRCLYGLSRTLRNARNSKQLTTMWSILSRNGPVVVDGGFLRSVGRPIDPQDESLGLFEIPTDSLAIRMVPVQEMLDLIRQNKRHLVVEHAPTYATSPGFLNAGKKANDPTPTRSAPTPTPTVSKISVPEDSVLLVSENFVARKIVWALHRLGCYSELTQFLEAFESARRELRLAESAQQGEIEIDCAELLQLTTLGNHVDALYVASLGQLRANTKILDRFHQHGCDLSRYIINRDAFRSLVNACMMERQGKLAKTIIDQSLDGSTVATFNVRPFAFALHANLRGEPKTLDGLHNAMHIYRRMFLEVGYILAPREWSMLVNACVYLNQPALALEVFRAYRVHGVAPFQNRFRQALRTACRNHQFDTAVAMAQTWVEIERAVPDKPTKAQSAAEAESFNKILWEMLKLAPTREHIDQILALMQERQSNAGALVLRRVVTHFFSDANEEELEPKAVLYRFFALWERCPDVIQRTSFVLHLVLEECESRGWADQCERVVEYALEQNMPLPISSTVRVMDRYAARGQFDEAIQLGELVLQPRVEKARAALLSNKKQSRQDPHSSIPDDFFESLLTCYLFRERFSDVGDVDEIFQLSKRRARANTKLAMILHDARSMAY